MSSFREIYDCHMYSQFKGNDEVLITGALFSFALLISLIQVSDYLKYC